MAIMTLETMTIFREQYRVSIAASYSGWTHMVCVLAIGLNVIIYALFQVPSVTEFEKEQAARALIEKGGEAK